MSTVRVGVIGCGKFATAQHLPNCVAAKNIELYHCSSRSRTGQSAAEHFGATKISADYREVLNDPDVDMVILSVPHDRHLFFIEETVGAGKNVLCEKPMTMTMDEAYRVVRAVREKRVKLCVDYMRRCAPAVVALKHKGEAIDISIAGKPFTTYDTALAKSCGQQLRRPRFFPQQEK